MATAILAVTLLLLAAGLAWAVSEISREKQRQAKLMLRMRRDAERQERAMLRLSEGLNASMRQVNHMSSDMEARQERMRRTLDERMGQMQRMNDQSLERVRQTVSEKLADVYKGLGEMREIGGGMADLRKMLGGVKTRGVWGEAQLRTLMEELFAPGQYVENAAIPADTQQRVEFALKLPVTEGEPRLLPIDAKFPQEDYLRLVEAQDSGDREAVKKCAQQLERAVLEQAKRIHDKYILPPQTADFAVMFLPTESLYAEVARREGLVERAQERFRVLISGPATFAALLTSIQMGLKSMALQRRSGEVLKLIAGMKRDFSRYDEAIQRTRQRLKQAERELDALDAQAKRVLRAMEAGEWEDSADESQEVWT